MRAKAVIGALYGDEGKGKHVDAFAFEAMRDHGACTVIRSNGGAQAAHTVQLPDGTRHVFHHFGSGTFAGASTHLSKYMIINAIFFNREWDALVALGYTPVISMSPECILTFPQDMLINQIVEMKRGGNRHGSCGLGIGETMERAERYRDTFRIKDFQGAKGHWPTVQRRFKKIRKQRLEALNITPDDLVSSEYGTFMDNNFIFTNYVAEIDLMLSRCSLIEDAAINTGQPIIFEAAQGLALDRDMGFFPYVTRSKTGLFNIAALCEEMGITDLDAVFVMRAYTSRHGAGPLDGEDIPMEGYSLEDPTNEPNEWQGTLRFAPLDLWLVKRMITLDTDAVRNRKVRIKRHVAITCLDQVPEMVSVFIPARYQTEIERDLLPCLVGANLDVEHGWVSNGPTRDHIEERDLVFKPAQ